MSKVVTKNTQYNTAVNNRMDAFDGVRSLSTRLVNALSATDASKETMDDIKALNRKMQGQRASKAQIAMDPSMPAPKTISTSQQSYDALIQHMTGMVAVLEEERSYAPNETDLKVDTLNEKIQSLKESNDTVAAAYAAVSNARIDRDKTLYKEKTGLVDTVAEVKAYVKSVFGATSPEFAQIKGIKFVREAK